MPILDFRCAGCGAVVAAEELLRVGMQCPNRTAPGDADHVLVPRDETNAAVGAANDDRSGNPFVTYRRGLTAWSVARARGVPDEEIVAAIGRLDAAIAGVDGRGFRQTPLARHAALDAALGFEAPGGVWIKDETENVSGSHKARHLFGVMLYLDVMSGLDAGALCGSTPASAAARHPEPRTSPAAADETQGPGAIAPSGVASAPPLAIASCGNAALAAAVLACAAGRRLRVFVPPSAHPRVLERLRALAAEIVTCERDPGERGDPCYLRFREALTAAVPFCCQGPDNALTIEGGQTIVWEMLDQLADAPLDRVFVQVGGGALASACARAWLGAARAGRASLPRFHAVQTAGGFPLARAWARVVLRAIDVLTAMPSAASIALRGPDGSREADATRALRALADVRGDDAGSVRQALAVPPLQLASIAGALRAAPARGAAQQALDEAAAKRSRFMFPWEGEPHSLAHGILDDETYDWHAVVEMMLASGGWPVIATEHHVAAANRIGREATGIDVDHTGSAGLAGVLALGPSASEGYSGGMHARERVAVIFSGVRR